MHVSKPSENWPLSIFLKRKKKGKEQGTERHWVLRLNQTKTGRKEEKGGWREEGHERHWASGPCQMKTSHFSLPAGSILHFGRHILRTLKASLGLCHLSAAASWSPFWLILAWQDSPEQERGPLSLRTKRTRARGSHCTASPWPSMHSRGSNDETARSSQRSVGSTLPFLSLPGTHPAQPPTAKVKEATNLNASLIHTSEPSILPAHSPREGGRTEQRSHPRPLGFHTYTNALLGTAAQHPGTQEK